MVAQEIVDEDPFTGDILLWGRFLLKYAEMSSPDSNHTTDQLKCHFVWFYDQVVRFHKFYERIEFHSGWTSTDFLDEVRLNYGRATGKYFIYLHCWETLRKF